MVVDVSVAPATLTLPLRAARKLFAILLALSIVLPTMLQPVKLVVLALIVLCLLVARETWTTRSTAQQWALDGCAVFYSLVGLAWAIAGMLRGNPGAASMLTVHVAYPIVAVLLWRIAQPGDWGRLSRLLMFSIALVLLSQALFVASFFDLDGGHFFQWFLGALDESTAVVDAAEGYVLFTLPNVSSLLFMAPWLCLNTVLSDRRQRISAVLALLVITALLFAGRRATLLALTGGVVAAVYAARQLGRGQASATGTAQRFAWLAVALTAFLAVGFASGVLNAELLAERLASIFDFSNNDSNIERKLQFDALMAGIADHPLLGNGLGAAASYIRSDEQPWAYELSYVALVFQFGLFGFTLFAAGVVYLLALLGQFVSLPHLPRSERISAACYLGGLVAFLIANATNPYLSKFDYMWVLFTPLALVRLYAGPVPTQGITSARHRDVANRTTSASIGAAINTQHPTTPS